MSTEGKKIKQAVQRDVPVATPQPRIRDYMSAILQMSWAGIKKHKKAVALAVVVVAVGLLGFRFLQNRNQNPNLSTDALIIRVSREANISGDPNPAILTVIDKEKTNQPFLDESKDGDMVLLYYKAKKAVLYRPAEDKIIKVGSYTPPNAKIQLRQGTSAEKRVNDVADLLKKVANTEIKTRDVSIKSDYSQTLVIDITDRYPAEAAAVAKALSANVRTIPQNESLPDADILVIVGTK